MSIKRYSAGRTRTKKPSQVIKTKVVIPHWILRPISASRTYYNVRNVRSVLDSCAPRDYQGYVTKLRRENPPTSGSKSCRKASASGEPWSSSLNMLREEKRREEERRSTILFQQVLTGRKLDRNKGRKKKKHSSSSYGLSARRGERRKGRKADAVHTYSICLHTYVLSPSI